LAWACFIDGATFTVFVIDAVTIITLPDASASRRVKRVHGSDFNYWKLEDARQPFDLFIIHPDKTGLAAAACTASSAFKLQAS